MQGNSIIERIQTLDLTLFERIRSQTTIEDQLALLAVQRITANMHKVYSYLEIGSYLGGSIQPHLLDSRCRHIYSIDTRPLQVPDDRSAGYLRYEDNSSEKMLELLGYIEPDQVSKIQCFDGDASEIEPDKIAFRPQIVFIDGEHTKNAVLSDFLFCKQVLGDDGTILFHDVKLIYPAIIEICKVLDRSKRQYIALKFRDNVFALFFDERKIHSDTYLSKMYKRHRHSLKLFLFKERLRGILPAALWNKLRIIKRKLSNIC